MFDAQVNAALEQLQDCLPEEGEEFDEAKTEPLVRSCKLCFPGLPNQPSIAVPCLPSVDETAALQQSAPAWFSNLVA
jgi:hypothetical protein